MNNHKRTSLFLFLLGGMVLSSCFTKKSAVEVDAASVTYDTHIVKLMEKYCYNCHRGAKPAADVQLDSYELVKKFTDQGHLIERLNDENNPMPPDGVISERDREIVKAWADNGFKKS